MSMNFELMSFLALEITWGLLPYFKLKKIDWHIDPLLSITNKMIGGVILDLTSCNRRYGSFRSRICSCFRRSRAAYFGSPSCRTCRSKCTHSISAAQSFYDPTSLCPYLFCENASAVQAGSVLTVAGRGKGNLRKINLDGVELVSSR